MTLDHQTLEAKIQCLLAHSLNSFSAPRNMAWVTDKRDIGQFVLELKGYAPIGSVAVVYLDGRGRGESSEDGRNVRNTHLPKTLNGTDPQLQVGAHWVFNHKGDIRPSEHFGNLLYRVRICRGAGSNPEHIHPGL